MTGDPKSSEHPGRDFGNGDVEVVSAWGVVRVMFTPGSGVMVGIVLSPEDARKLGKALARCADEADGFNAEATP